MNDESADQIFQNDELSSGPEAQNASKAWPAMVTVSFPWQKAYLEAVLETNDLALRQRVATAEDAIRAREKELSKDHQGTREEQHAMAMALAGLETMRKERLSN